MRHPFHVPFPRLATVVLALAAPFLPPTLISAAEPFEPRFEAVTIDPAIQIGYGLAIADVNGDRRPDILLVDKSQVAWYENPAWKKHVIAENLTKNDHVCLAARDIDGDGRCEIAVGAGWNPGDTVNSGAVFFLKAPADRTGRWEPVPLPHEPTVHRMRWLKNRAGGHDLVVVPLHGRGNQNGQGAGVRVLAYSAPADPSKPWSTSVIDDAWHATHNFDPFIAPSLRIAGAVPDAQGFLLGGREGVARLTPPMAGTGPWKRELIADGRGGGAGEVRAGRLAGSGTFVATVEPMHGNQLALYRPDPSAPGGLWKRTVLDDSLADGHALVCGDFLGTGGEQIAVGWRAMNRPKSVKVGVKLFTPLDAGGDRWRAALIDDNTMACEDLVSADLDGDGRLDLVAAGRATKNVKVYFNRTPRPVDTK